MITDTTVDNLLSYLDQSTTEPVFLKIYDKKENALSFAKGELCLGTIEYYRNKYNGDGRGDCNDSKASYPFFINYSPIDNPLQSTSKHGYMTYILTCLVFCLVLYDHSTGSKMKLKKLLTRQVTLGGYICVIKNRLKFINSLNNLKFIREINDNMLDKFTPNFKDNVPIPTLHGPVKYVNNPDDSGFQKLNVEKYSCQQEYRFCFDFNVDNMTTYQKGRLKGLFLYTVNEPINCVIFSINNRKDD